jgi:uncharacterized membrane protein YraQ (UPF0718 family)
MFGLKVTLIYNVLGVVIAITGGMLIQRLRLDKYVKQELLKIKSKCHCGQDEAGNKLAFRRLLVNWWNDGWQITKQIFPYVVFGVGIGALIHGFVPASFVELYLSSKAWWAVPTAVILGAPLYASSVSVIPIMQALVGKGVPLGTALAFMTSIVVISIPELMILRKVMKWQLLAIFVSITIVGVVIMGYTLNAIL